MLELAGVVGHALQLGKGLNTSPNTTESMPVVAFSALDTPTNAISLPVPMEQTLWWCASLSSNWRSSVWARLGVGRQRHPVLL